MAQEAVNAIVQAFQRGMEQVQQVRESEKRAQEFEEQRDLQERQFAAQQKANDAMMELRNKEFELTQQQNKAAQAHQEFSDILGGLPYGTTPAGISMIPGLPVTPSRGLPSTPEQIPIGQTGTPGATGLIPSPKGPLVLSGLEKNTYIGPQGNTYQVTPYAQSPVVQVAKQQADEAVANRIRETQATQAGAQASQEKLENLKYGHELALADIANGYNVAAATRRENFEREQRQDEGKIRLSGDYINQMGDVPPFARRLLGLDGDGRVGVTQVPGMTDNDFKDLAIRVGQGSASSQDMKAEYPKIGQRTAILRALKNVYGVEPLDDKGVKSLQGLTMLSQDLQRSRDMMDLAANNWIQMQFDTSPAKQKFDGMARVIQGNVPTVSLDVNKNSRFSNPELNRYDNFLIPKISLGTGMLGTARNQYDQQIKGFTDILQKEINSVLEKVPERQKPYITHYLESHGIPYAGQPPDGHPNAEPPKGVVPKIPGSRLLQPTQPTEGLPNIGTPYTAPAGLPPLPSSKMWVRRSGDNQIVNINRDEWDSRKYERIQ